MNWLAPAIAWAGALVSIGGAAAVWLLLRRFMAGPPGASAADMADALAERSTLRSSQSEAGRSGERHWTAGGR